MRKPFPRGVFDAAEAVLRARLLDRKPKVLAGFWPFGCVGNLSLPPLSAAWIGCASSVL